MGAMGEAARKVREMVRERVEGINQCTVNEYEKGQGIGGHVDTKVRGASEASGGQERSDNCVSFNSALTPSSS